jgi:HEPN domain-containing protein
VVEKCLKAMFFYCCGISGGLLSSHDVTELATKLREKTSPPNDTDMQSVRRIAGYYLSTRYPNRQPSHIVPAEAFNENEAKLAVDAASKVYALVEKRHGAM